MIKAILDVNAILKTREHIFYIKKKRDSVNKLFINYDLWYEINNFKTESYIIILS